MNEDQKTMKEDESVCDVKSILKTIFETQNKAKLPAFQGIFPETIPFILYSSETIEPFLPLVLHRTHMFYLELVFSVLIV